MGITFLNGLTNVCLQFLKCTCYLTQKSTLRPYPKGQDIQPALFTITPYPKGGLVKKY